MREFSFFLSVVCIVVCFGCGNRPKDAQAYSNRGETKRTKGDLDGAIADCTIAIELNPKDVHAYGIRAKAKASKGDMDGAIADFQKAITLDPKDPDELQRVFVPY